MSRVRRKYANNLSTPLVAEVHNPFSDQSQAAYRERQTKKSPKHSKRAGKCFQLVLICQKLLKPFSSANKLHQPDATKHVIGSKEKSNSTQEISETNRILGQSTVVKPCKVDAGVQTNAESFPDISQMMLEDGYDTNQGSEDFPYDVDESLKEPYWDLDIDSAIVGDYNSMSALSIDEQIDPHYATINLTADGRVIDKPQYVVDQSCFASVYPCEKISYPNSCTSSPKSGIYSRIMKPPKNNEPNSQISDYYRLHTGSRVMSIRSQLGLNHGPGLSYRSSESNVYPMGTPDIPIRNYGSSVINYVTKLQQNGSNSHSCISTSILFLEPKLSSANLYSPIWFTERSPAQKLSNILLTPATEPVAQKRTLNKILHQLNPNYLDDSSEDASSISMNSPAKVKYSYPQHFSDNGPTKCSYAVDDLTRFRHVDSEPDVKIVRDKQYGPQSYQDEQVSSDVMVVDGDRVPSSSDNRCSSDGHVNCMDSVCLAPLMERSCEEDYFKRDVLSSLDYINV